MRYPCVQTRVPGRRKVLMCTTTNKAIDSLAEKLHSAGYRDIVALGNASRLGPTSATLTLPEHVKRHKATSKMEAVRKLVSSAAGKWSAIVNAAQEAAEAETGINVKQLSASDTVKLAKLEGAEERHVKGMWQPEKQVWLERLQNCSEAITEFASLKENSPPLTAYLSGVYLISDAW